nr:reverse transcriptase domain-containing protein [Tanacetum cinerariifolium]
FEHLTLLLLPLGTILHLMLSRPISKTSPSSLIANNWVRLSTGSTKRWRSYLDPGGHSHSYQQTSDLDPKNPYLIADGNTFPELRDNIQGYVSAAAVNYNQGNFGYHPSGVANQIRPTDFAQPIVQNNQNRFSQLQGYNRVNNFNQDQSYQAPTQQNQVVSISELDKIKRMNEANMKGMKTQINNVKNELRNEMKNSIQASMFNKTNELKNMRASIFQMNTTSTSGSGPLPSNTIANPKGKLKTITTRSGIVLDGPSVPIPPPFINSEEDEHVKETLTDQDLAEYTINEGYVISTNT